MIKLYTKSRQLLIYIIWGSFSTIVDRLLFVVLTDLVDMMPYVSQVISFLWALMFSFFFHQLYTFWKTDALTYRRIVWFVIIQSLAVWIGTLLFMRLYTLYSQYIVAFLISRASIAIVTFFIHKFITFKSLS